MTHKRLPMSRVVDAIAERREIDWEAERAGSPALSESLRELQSIERIARGYRRASDSMTRTATATPAVAESRVPRASSREREERHATHGAGMNWGKLEILERLGSGSFGEVYRAFDPSLAIEVALKLWPPTADHTENEQLLAEARRLARVRHPNVLTVHGADLHEGRVGMWTDLLSGRTLAELLNEQGCLGAEEAALVGMELCRALAALHAAGLIHGDVKAANVIREQGGRVVLFDFGTATEVRQPASQVDPVAMAGTPLAMAPELLRGGPATFATDIYSLGVLLYYLVSGAYPVEASTLEELRQKHRGEQSVPLRDRRSDLPIEFIRLVERASNPRPDERFASPGAMERALADWVGGREPRAALRPARSVAGAGTQATPRGVRIPEPLTNFIGRETQIAECLRLRDPGHLLTLTGPGGCGKTRLAACLAERLLEGGDEEVIWVELSSIETPERLSREVARCLEVLEQPGRELLGLLADRLRSRRATLILDNCEHLREGCARLVQALASACPDLAVMATSRERLGIDGERVFGVPPLTLPGDSTSERMESVAECESTRLFVDRALLVQPGFRLNPDNAGVVAEICRRLDGLPLAIELAAARMRALSVYQVGEMLRDRFRLLAGGALSSPSHHQTLWETFEWSYRQLPPEEQRLLRFLSVFTGGWSLDDAAVWEMGQDEYAALDQLERLADKSLVVVDPGTGRSARYRLLETVRQFAVIKLEGAGELEAARDRHAQHFLALAERHSQELWHAGRSTLTARVEQEHGNILAAFSWLESRGDRVRGLRMAAAMARFWYLRGHFALGRELINRWLRDVDPETPKLAIAKATYGAGELAVWQGDFHAAQGFYQAALVAFKEIGELPGVGRCFNGLGIAANGLGDNTTRVASYEKSLAIFRELGDARGIAVALGNLGVTLGAIGQLSRAREIIAEAVVYSRQAGDRDTMVGMLVNLAELSMRLGRPEEARAPVLEALRAGENIATRVLAGVLEGAAKLASALEDHARAARWFASADALREVIGCMRLPEEDEEQRASLTTSRAMIGDHGFKSAWDAGHALPAKAAVAESVAWLASSD